MEDRYEISFEEGGVGAMETIMTGGLAKAVEKTLDTITGDDAHGWDCTIKDSITGLKVTCWGVTKEKAQEKALEVIEKDIEDFEYEKEREREREQEKERELERIQLKKEKAEREKQTDISSDNSTSSNENGCIKVIAWIVGIGLAVFAVVWLAINIVLPVVLLNSALIFVILSFVLKKYKTLFTTLALVGGAYMILDVTNGWLSSMFVENIVKSPYWISAFVYINAAAIGLSTWLLIKPLWLKSEQMEPTNKRKSLLLKGGLILIVAIAIALVPIVYNSVQNPFIIPTFNNVQTEGNQTNNGFEIEVNPITSIPKNFTVDCSFSKSKGAIPVFLTNFNDSGLATMNINGELVKLELKSIDNNKGYYVEVYEGFGWTVEINEKWDDSSNSYGYITVSKNGKMNKFDFFGTRMIDIETETEPY